MKENGFSLNKGTRYHTENITNADNADDLVFLVHTPVKAESLLYSLKQAAICIGLHVNSDKTELYVFC